MRQTIIVIATSVIIHLLLWQVFTSFRAQRQPSPHTAPASTVLQVQVEPVTPKRILEAEQEETEAPTDAQYLGRHNHRAKVETKTTPRRAQASAKARQFVPQKNIVPATVQAKALPKLSYAQLLQESQHRLAAAGYQDFIPDDLAPGDAIDISTSEYRYIGYFGSLRKAIALAWHYPAEAVRRGQQGIVHLRFAIAADGTASQIKVTQSSGYDVLDIAIVDAIRLAAPFSPLPPGIKRDHLTVKGSFHYVLRGI